MARPGTRPTANKTDYEIRSEVPANQKVPAAEQNYMISKANESGLNDAWSSVVKFDDEYYPDIYRMSGAIEYTIDAANAGTGNGRKDTIVGDGNTITFTGFTIRDSDLSHSSNVVTTVDTHIYTIVFFRVGGVSEVYLRDTGEVITPPTVSSATVESADPDALIIVFREVVNITNVTGLSLDGDWAGTTITGINSGSGTNTISLALDTPIVGGESGNFVYSVTNTIQDLNGTQLASGSTPVTSPVNILFSDTFDGTTIDTAKWTDNNTDPNTAFTQDDELILTVTAGGSTGAQSIDTDSKYNVNTSGQTTVISWVFSDNILGDTYLQLKNDSPASTIALNEVSSGFIGIVIIAPIAGDTTETTTVVPNNRVKMILDGAGSVSFKYWGGSSWLQLGTNASYPYDDEAAYYLRFLIAGTGISIRTWDDVYVTSSDYSTEIPT